MLTKPTVKFIRLITVDNKVKELVSQNKVPEAVKLVMDHYKCGLKQAKDYIDKLTGRIKTEPIPQRKSVISLLGIIEIAFLLKSR
jgi:hypothetical protein